MSRNAEYADVKYPRLVKTLTSAQEPPAILLSQPYATGVHCWNHQIETARMRACDVMASPQNMMAVFLPYVRMRLSRATIANLGNEKTHMATALVMTFQWAASMISSSDSTDSCFPAP